MWETDNFLTMADGLPVMMWSAGSDGRCTLFNRSWLNFTGRALQDELEHGWISDVHPSDAVRCDAACTKSFELRREFHVECRLRKADGEYRWMLVSGSPRFTNGDAFTGYIGTAIDIEDIRMARRDYLSHKKLETVGRLAGGIAHDFNNYLGSILADADLALADLPPGSACGEEVDRIRTVAIRASETVRELLVYMGQEHSQIGLVDLSQLVQEMLALLKSSIKGHARLTTNLAKDSLLVFAEAPELRQLVMNLVLNASDALGQGGAEIQVTTSRTTITQKDSDSVLGPGEYARLEVLDNGGGMSHDVQARIFDAYFTTKKSGRGLGLSIVQRIVHRYGGDVRCYSAPGEGTRFTVILPLASASEREHSVPESTPELARS